MPEHPSNSSSFEANATNKVTENIYATSLPGLYFVASNMHPDARGFFREISIIPDIELVTREQFHITQMNHARSEQNVIRGFHMGSWNKLITITSGVAYCVFVDLRPHSPTFLQKERISLGFGDGAVPGSLFVPKGLLNSLCVTHGPLDYVYAIDKVYKEKQATEDFEVSLFDPTLGVDWPISRESMILSERDRKAPLLDEIKHLL